MPATSAARAMNPRCLLRARPVPPACQAVEMLQADPGQVGSLRVRKDLLTRLDFNHAIALSYPQIIPGLSF